ncbi:MAG: ImmA/IrrE family metallo-endopeptidase [Candidatus Micrarchaeia archaeon]
MEKFYKEKNVIKVRISSSLWNYIANTFPEDTINKIKKDYPKLDKWINGQDSPTIKQLEKISKKFKIPFGYFFLEKIPQEEIIPLYRRGKKWKGKISPELKELINKLSSIQNLLSEYLREINAEHLGFVRSCSIESNFKEVALKINQLLGLKEQWIFNFRNRNQVFNFLRDQIEKIGVFVFANSIFWFNTHSKLNSDEFKGFCLIDNYAPIIFINTRDFISSQIFTMVHEFVHVLLGESEILSNPEILDIDAEKIEIFCNKVTSEFLVPEKLFIIEWKESPEDYKTIAEKFHVSPIVIAIKAKMLNFIDEKKFTKFYDTYTGEISEKNVHQREGFGDFYAICRKFFGSNYIKILQQALNDGFINFRDVLNYTGLKESNFDKLIDQYQKRGTVDTISV